jgi:hypothetical protein
MALEKSQSGTTLEFKTHKAPARLEKVHKRYKRQPQTHCQIQVRENAMEAREMSSNDRHKLFEPQMNVVLFHGM